LAALAAPSAADAADHLRMLTATNLAAGIGEPGGARRILDALSPRGGSDPGAAAYRNSVRFHARTQDDFHPAGRVHVGAITLAATLALAEEAGERTLDCLAAGYRAMCAIAVPYSRHAQARGMRPSGMFGPFGAAASAATALGLDRDGVANALGLAAVMTGGTTQTWTEGSDEWALEAGAAARAGVEAALLSRAGVIAATEAIEGRFGWAGAFFEDEGASLLAAELDAGGERIGEVASKPYPVSGIAEVPTHLAAQVQPRLAGASPSAVRLSLSPSEVAYPGSTNRGPFPSRSAALMSLPFCLAAALTEGLVSLDRLERAGDGSLDELIARISIEADESLTEEQAVLRVEVGDEVFESRGEGAEVLYPDWSVIAGEAAALAERSEAAAAPVAAAVEELTKPAPDARALCQILEGTDR
jgi:2-methylcitrate dehydratase PrpD